MNVERERWGCFAEVNVREGEVGLFCYYDPFHLQGAEGRTAIHNLLVEVSSATKALAKRVGQLYFI